MFNRRVDVHLLLSHLRHTSDHLHTGLSSHVFCVLVMVIFNDVLIVRTDYRAWKTSAVYHSN